MYLQGADMTQTFFRLKTDQCGQNFYIYLYGVFDGSSAFNLLEVITKHIDQDQSIFINTDHIVHTYPFGKTILNWNLPQSNLRSKLHFAGTHAREILPDGCRFLSERSTSGHTRRKNCKIA